MRVGVAVRNARKTSVHKQAITEGMLYMRLMIASDIHGSAVFCRRMFERYDEEMADRLILLGDLLYHGPRNDLPEGYAPKEVIELLNGRAEELLCVRGNCEAEVDQMVLTFPVMAEYALLPLKKNVIYITHGHKTGVTNPPPLKKGDILLHGHTHIPACEEHGTFTYLNPGSVSIPKEGSPRSYMILEDGRFVWKMLDSGEVFMEMGQKNRF